jgi:hypothetical protein
MSGNDSTLFTKADYDPQYLLQGQEVVPIYSDKTPFKGAEFPDMVPTAPCSSSTIVLPCLFAANSTEQALS